MFRQTLSLLGSAVCAALLCVNAFAQATAGSQVSGTIQDGSNNVVAGAQVTITQTDTAQSRTAVSNAAGGYTIPNLPVGPYQLKVTKDGFKSFTQSGIVLQVNSNPEINVTLDVGAVTEQVSVTAGVAGVETISNGIGQVIDQQRVVELPLNGRVATELIFLSGLATSALRPSASTPPGSRWPRACCAAARLASAPSSGFPWVPRPPT